MTIAAVTIVRDSEKYIIPHLKMYEGVQQNIALFVDAPIQGGSVGHKGADSSEELIREHCPDVEIHHTTANQWGASLFNIALGLSECDKTVLFHADVVLSPENWEKLRELLLTTDYDVYRLDMSKCTINYYRDFEHGVRDCVDNEPIAFKSAVRLGGIYDLPDGASVFTIDKDFENHHFTGWKGVFITDEWLNGAIASESNVYIHDLKPKDGWIPCPPEIRALFL